MANQKQKQQNTGLTLRDFWAERQGEIAEYLPQNPDFDKAGFMQSVALCFADSTGLSECLGTPQGQRSVYYSLCRAAAAGLSLNPQDGKAGLIAYGGKCAYQKFKNGIVEQLLNTGLVESIETGQVFEKDEFRISKTETGDSFVFAPARKNRGDLDGCFSIIRFTSGITKAHWMTTTQIELHRDKYSKMFKANPGKSPWSTSFGAMGEKTVLIMHVRRLYTNDNQTGARLFEAVKDSDEIEAEFKEQGAGDF